MPPPSTCSDSSTRNTRSGAPKRTSEMSREPLVDHVRRERDDEEAVDRALERRLVAWHAHAVRGGDDAETGALRRQRERRVRSLDVDLDDGVDEASLLVEERDARDRGSTGDDVLDELRPSSDVEALVREDVHDARADVGGLIERADHAGSRLVHDRGLELLLGTAQPRPLDVEDHEPEDHHRHDRDAHHRERPLRPQRPPP